MAYLSVKIDHVAVLREARRKKSPDVSHAAMLAELGGADGITVHLRRDRRHIRERDLYILKEVVRTRLTVEIAPTEENITRMLEVKPYMTVFVPEIDKEITTQSGLAPNEDFDMLEEATRRLQEVDIKVGLLIDCNGEAVKRAARMQVNAVKLYTGGFANAETEEGALAEMGRLERTATAGQKTDMMVLAGQGLDYINLLPLARLGAVDEFVIGQSIVSRAVLVGMERATAEMREIARDEGSSVGY